MEKTTNEIGNIKEIEKTVKENGGTAIIIAKEHNGNENGESEKEKIAKRTQMSAIIESIIAGIEIEKETKGLITTISCNGTKLSFRLNQNGNGEKFEVEAEISNSIISNNFFLTEILLEDNKENINLQMIKDALEKNPRLADACEKLFFSPTTVTYNQQPSNQQSS